MGKKENEIGGNDAVCTPKEVFEPVLEALGFPCFTLDPCSHPSAIVPVETRVLLPEYEQWEYTLSAAKDDWPGRKNELRIYGDGLDADWTNHDAWLNPPYSQLQYWKKYLWLHKLATEAHRGVAFLPVRSSSGWWHHGVLRCEQAHILVQLKGRVKHVGHEHGSPFHQAIVAYNVLNRPGLRMRDKTLRRWREAFNHPHDAFVSSLRSMRA